MNQIKWSCTKSIALIRPDWDLEPLTKFAQQSKNSFVNGPFGSDLLSSELQKTGYPVIYIRDITGGKYVRKSTVCVTEEKYDSLNACQVSYSDVILSKVGTPPCEAAVYNSSKNGIVTQDVIRIKTGDIERSQFLAFMFNSDIGKRQIKRIQIVGTRDRVSLTDLKKVRLPLPSLPEQRKIAKILSTWDKAITTTEKLIATSKQQKKALMQQLLTGKKRLVNPETGQAFEGEWEEKLFKNILKLDRGSSPRPIIKYITESDDGVNWIKIGDTKDNDLFINSTKQRITKEGAKKSRQVSKGEIIVSNSMSYGKPYILNIDGYIHDGWFVLRNYENDFSIQFLLQLLVSELIQSQYKRLAAGGVVSNISSDLVYAVKVTVPTLSEQQKIAQVLTTADQEIELLKIKLAHFQQEKKALMQQLLTGKRRVKVDDAEAA